MVSNIRETNNPIYLEGIAKGELVLCNMVADTLEFGEVYFNELAATNILSLAKIQDRFKVDVLRDKQDRISAFTATNKNSGRRYLFNLRRGGLYMYSGVRIQSQGRTYVSTVKENKKQFNKDEIKRADRALLLRQRLGFPSISEFKRIIYNKTIKDLEITTRDVENMVAIYGTQYADAAGKSTYVPTPTPRPDNIPAAAAAYTDKIKEEPLVLHGDIFFIDKMPFLLTVSKPLNYVICTYLKSRTWINILNTLAAHRNVYSKNGYSVGKLRFDREKGVTCIEKLLQEKLNIALDTSAPYQKIPVAERKIRLVKERCRCEINNLGYKVSRTMLAHLPKYVSRRLNSCTSRIVSVNASPYELLTGKAVSAATELKIGFGEMAYVYKVVKGGNGMASRDRLGICIGLASNQEASGIFYDVGKPANQIPLVADNYKVAPMPEQVVEYLNELACENPVVFDESTMSIRDDTAAIAVDTDEYGFNFEMATDDISQPLPPADIGMEAYIHVNETADDLEIIVDDISPLRDDFMDDLLFDDLGFDLKDEEDDDLEIIKILEDMISPRGDSPPESREHTSADNITPESDNMFPESAVADTTPLRGEEKEEQEDTRNPIKRMATRSQTSQKLTYCVSKVEANRLTFYKNYRVSLKKGIEIYGEAARESIRSELQAMEKKEVFRPLHYKDLTPGQKNKSIRSFIFLKEKLKPDGSFDKLKSRLTANGKTQNREEVEMMFGNTSSPTVAFSSIMSLIAIAKAEGRHIATADIKNAYLNADLSGEGLVVVLDSVVTSEYIKIRPGAARYVNKKGELYCALDKALYGTVEGAKAWYDDIAQYLMDIGFERNSHDLCVFNACIDGVQVSIGLYVDDLLITSISKELIEHLHQSLLEKYGEVNFDISVKANYLGMVVDNTKDEYVEVSMPAYVQSVIDELNIGSDETSDTPAAVNLFTINENDKQLDDIARENFHTMVAKILYLAKHARPDLLLAATFLCTRVQRPGVEDLKKLRRVGRYLNKTKELFIRVVKDSCMLNKEKDAVHVNVFVDASFAVHDTMRSHTGAIIAIGNVPVYVKSSKQKLNASSSTQAEIIGISDILSQSVSMAGFVEEQMNKNVITTMYEDNMSTITMMKNGRPKAENTRHINIRYFHINDYINRGEIELTYVNTKQQHGDYFTKPLQGADFEYHRNYIMGHASS